MNNYQKPKCNCGTYLHARRSEYWSVTRAIQKNGEISQKTIKISTGLDDSDYEIKLICPKCGNTYKCEYDEKDRIIKGELII